MKLAALCVLVGCAAPDVAPPLAPVVAPMTALDAALVSVLPVDAEPVTPVEPEPEVWLKGSTHVHAKASGDSSMPIPDVIRWYEERGYDFIAITDHNRVSEIDGADTRGHIALRDADPNNPKALVVLSGIELTHNPSGCLPQGDPSKKCRIHVNVLGPTARPGGKLEWAERHSHERIDMYRAALFASRALGGALVQINHPQWFWGMNPELLAELAKRGALLVEIANAQFMKWGKGDKDHPSMEQLWDSVLARGLTMWGVASDDAHDYPVPGHHHKMKWPAGGGWVVVKAHRNAQAIVDALAAGHFYASTGVVLDKADVVGTELVVEVDPKATGAYQIDWIENGTVVASEHGKSAHRELPATGYLRADVTCDDGTQAWVEPARRQ